MTAHITTRPPLATLALALLATIAGIVSASAAAPNIPIRAGASNAVPACATPERLMSFVASRNPRLDPRYRDIARLYKQHGETWRVRWDYAFFQMVVETNALQFRRGDGTPGDVKPKQNNFAGVGTTGGGVPGDSYPDISTGVLAQIQHLVVYSGERIERPVAPRTQLVQDSILKESVPVAHRRPVTFQDLAGRWAADRVYGRSIETIAELFRAAHCTSVEPPRVAEAPVAPKPRPAIRPAPVAVATAPSPSPAPAPPAATAAPPSQAPSPKLTVAATAPVKLRAVPVRPAPGGEAAATETATQPAAPPVHVFAAPRQVTAQPFEAAPGCRVQSASFGGRKALLIRAMVDGRPQFTALQVLEGFEGSMSASFIAAHAPGGERVGDFETSEAALAEARRRCAAEPR